MLKPAAQNGLQPVDLSRHLGGIAALIELCFGAELDASGRGFLREMQFLSRTGPALRVLQGVLLGQQPWNLGFVWVEGGRVVGSVSTQPTRARARTWLVANVAVHPEFRRHGIALALMRATLDLVRSQGGQETILQVEDLPPTEGQSFMKVGKFRGILAQVDKKVRLNGDARLTFEVSAPDAPMQIFDVAGVTIDDGSAFLPRGATLRRVLRDELPRHGNSRFIGTQLEICTRRARPCR